ncbi:DUF4296 domain-containing protein [Allomuricauda sp. SCSIO 65647]|uniref:DUF4296 domain-containing protein n=1 Tax=Allomuricauda sp. SCSIO 65647 TaxID=2908843 RepID=UPI001F237404|nr:DUF4296 domain-containing protein [Muricauda sp. SCSIO 65647]UJH66193.1 DUF4296 domain-containing protein [Muricauda sp. SCSIO 65647]
MKKGRLIAIVLVSLVWSCAEKVVEKPNDLLSEAQMAEILYDLAIFQAAESANKSILEKTNLEAMQFIYGKYEIDSARFAQSDLYYASLPLKYQTIYENVEARLDKEAKVMEEGRKKKKDSLGEATKKRSDSVISANAIKKASDSLP